MPRRNSLRILAALGALTVHSQFSLRMQISCSEQLDEENDRSGRVDFGCGCRWAFIKLKFDARAPRRFGCMILLVDRWIFWADSSANIDRGQAELPWKPSTKMRREFYLRVSLKFRFARLFSRRSHSTLWRGLRWFERRRKVVGLFN